MTPAAGWFERLSIFFLPLGVTTLKFRVLETRQMKKPIMGDTKMKRLLLPIALIACFLALPGQAEAQFRLPKIPKIKKPKIDLPKVKIPKPKLEIPKVRLPDVELPKPRIPRPKLPKIDPKLPIPGLNPTFPIPKPEFPEIDPRLPFPGVNPFPNPIDIPDLTNPIKKIGNDLEANLKRKTRQFEGMINRTVVDLSRAVQATRREFESLARAIKNNDEKLAASIFQSIARRNPYLQKMITNAIKDNMQSVTICGTLGASYGFGIEGAWGIALNPRDVLNAEALTGSVIVDGTISGGIQAGGGVDIVIGFCTAHPNNLTGAGQGVGADFKVKAGGSASVSFDLPLTQFTGFSVGLGPGAEAGIKTQMGYTRVLKKFTTRASEQRTNYPISTPQHQTFDQPNTYPVTQSVQSSPRMLGVHSVTTQANGNMFGQQVTQVIFGSAAQRAGLEAGDIIVTANGTPVQSQETLRQVIQNSGSRMLLKVINVRNGQLVDIQVNF